MRGGPDGPGRGAGGFDGDDVRDLGEQAERSEWLDHAVRLGLVAYAVVHVLLGYLCVQLALGGVNEDASTQGAMHTLARQPLGRTLVWVVALGMLLLVVWRVVEAGWGHRGEGEDRTRKRFTSAGKAVVYAVIGFSAVKVAVGAGSGRSGGWTATVMGWPAGQWLIALVGLAVLAYAANLARRGWTEKFAEHLDTDAKTGTSGAAFLVVGKVGHLAKGLSLGLVGLLTVVAGVTHDAQKGGGLDQALQQVLQEPYGRVLVAVVGVGLWSYAGFCFLRARFLNR